MFLSLSLRLGVFAFFAAAVCLPAQAQADKEKKVPNGSKYDISKSLGGTYVAAKSVTYEQTRLVLYRAPIQPDASVDKTGVISVYLDDRYHASLQKEAFSVVCLSGKKIEVRTRFLLDHTADIYPEHDTRHTVAMNGGDSIFLRVTPAPDNKSRIDLVSAQVAGKDLANAKQQIHTLSRVSTAQPCREAEETRIVFDPNVITVDSDIIFDSKNAEVHVVSSQGREELKNIIQKINTKYKAVQDLKVHIVGFADDTKDDVANQRISQERAKSVHAYFKSQGLRFAALTFEGRGTQEAQKAQLFGLSPRRVEVEVAVNTR